MKPTNNADVLYSPNDPPADPQQLQRFLREELAKISVAVNRVADGYDSVTYVEPDKPRDGMRRNADGVQWDPGSGKGLYRFDGVAWNFLG